MLKVSVSMYKLIYYLNGQTANTRILLYVDVAMEVYVCGVPINYKICATWLLVLGGKIY